MTTLARIVSGRRSKFVVLAAWLVALVAMGPLIGQFESKQRNEPSSFLPEEAESVRALELSDQFANGEGVSAIAVFAREDGLTAEDRETIEGTQAELAASPPEGVVAVRGADPDHDSGRGRPGTPDGKLHRSSSCPGPRPHGLVATSVAVVTLVVKT